MKRFWEIDFFRGIAIIKMIISNAILDVVLFTSINVGDLSLIEKVPLAAAMFMFLMGLSLSISYSRVKRKKTYSSSKYFKRGIKIFFLGLVITAITALLFPYQTIYFGVLHFAGLAIILSPFFLRYHRLNAVLGAAIIAVGLYLQTLRFGFPYLLWLGLAPYRFSTLDYFPVFPWLGLVLIGIFIGQIFYKNGRRIFSLMEMPRAARPLCFLGRHSLLIYFLHQPIIVGLLTIL